MVYKKARTYVVFFVRAIFAKVCRAVLLFESVAHISYYGVRR